MAKLPKFTFDLHVNSIEVSLISLINQEKFKVFPVLSFYIRGIHVFKELPIQFPDSPQQPGPNTIHSLILYPEYFFTINLEISEISAYTTSQLLSLSIKSKLNINPHKSHPIIPNLLLDFHIPGVFIKINSNLLPLLHIINSIEADIAASSVIYDSRKYITDVIRIMDTEYIQEYRNMIIHLNTQNASKILKNFYSDHFLSPDKCLHCLFKYIKLLSFINITVGNMNDDQKSGIHAEIFCDNNKTFDISCKHLMCSIEEKFFSKSINVMVSDIIGNNSIEESIRIYSGNQHIGMQPYLPVFLKIMFPYTNDLYFSNVEVLGYQIFRATELSNSYILNESL